jgi:hypothetical protein
MNLAKYQSQVGAARSVVGKFRKDMKFADMLAVRPRIAREFNQQFARVASVQDVIDSIADAGLMNDPEFKRQLQGLSSICNRF